MTESTTELDTLRAEVAELRRAVLAQREELDRRDLEACGLESAVEFLIDRERTTLYVLGWVVKSVFGDHPGTYRGDKMLDHLYSGPRHPAGFRQGTFTRWNRPSRRWAQYGSLADLRAVADEHGVKVRSWERRRRESLIRALWEAEVLAPFDRHASSTD